MSGEAVVATILIVMGMGTLTVLARSFWLTPLIAQRVSMTAAAVPTLGWVLFYIAVETGLLSFDTLRDWSRIVVVLTFGAFTLQAIMVAWSQSRRVLTNGQDDG